MGREENSSPLFFTPFPIVDKVKQIHRLFATTARFLFTSSTSFLLFFLSLFFLYFPSPSPRPLLFFFFLFNDRRISNVRTNVQGKRKVKSCHSSVGCARKVWQIVFHWFTASSFPPSSTIPPVHPQFPREIRKPCSPGWNIIEVDPRNLFRCFIRCCVASTREDSLSIAEQFK